MTVGEIIKQARKERGLSQEQLAEQMIVSRAAIAKWESNHGIPDIENLKKLSELFDMSIDELVGNTIKRDKKKTQEKIIDYYAAYIGKRCSVELRDWNDGVFDSYVLNQDETFLYYVTFEKKAKKVGALAKRYIDGIIVCPQKENGKIDILEYREVNKEYFLNKQVDIYLEEKHIWDGILGRDTEIFGAGIADINEDYIKMISGSALEIDKVTKIETTIHVK